MFIALRDWLGILKLFLKNEYTWVLIALLSISLYLMIYANIFGMKDFLIDYLQHIPSYPHAKPNVAFFSGGNITTDQGSPFNICSDSRIGGKSHVDLEIVRKSAQGNYLRASFDLNRGNAQTENTYVCFYADFDMPQSNYNLDKYQGIRFKSRLNVTRGDISNLLAIVSIDTRDEECLIPPENNYLEQLVIGTFSDVQVDFKHLGKPSYMRVGNIPPFDPRAAYRVTFAIRGENEAGTLDVDDIQFY